MGFPSTVTRYPYSSKDAHHKVTYGTSASLSCNYSKKDQVVSGQNGKDILTAVWLQFPAGTSISEKDKIVLPDGTTGPVVLVIPVHYPHNGNPLCVEAYLGKESV